ncbi:MAG: phosphoglycerate mutase family protein [Caldilineaceae bacterium]
MNILEVRRHSMRKAGGGSQLSQAGVDYARTLGATLGPFARVVTSVVPRTRETAIAMGFAVDYEIVSAPDDDAIYAELEGSRWWEAAQPFVAAAAIVATKGATWRYAQKLLAAWRDLLTPLPEGAHALLIGHSGELELALVAAFPHADHATWGAPFGHCEGARLIFDGNPAHFADVQLLRR